VHEKGAVAVACDKKIIYRNIKEKIALRIG
jgi:hypothetical protein